MKKPARMKWYREKLKHLIRDPYLSTEAKYLWVLLDSFANIEGIDCWPTVETLMRHSQRGKKWVERYLRELQQTCRIKIVGKKKTRFGWANMYHILYANICVKPALCSLAKKDPRGRVQKGPTYQVTSTSNSDVAATNLVPFNQQPPVQSEDSVSVL